MKKSTLYLSVSLFMASSFVSLAAGETVVPQVVFVSKKTPVPVIKDKKLKAEVQRWLGAPYKAGGTSPKGTDCSGFVYSVYKKVYGVSLPRRSRDMYKIVNKKKERKLKEGDLVFFRTLGARISHVGIYIADGYFVHASSSRGVVWSNLDEEYYKKNFAKGGAVNK